MPVLYVYIYSPLSHLHVCFQQRFWFSLGRMKMCYLTKWEGKLEWYKYIQLLCHLDFEKFDWTWALWSSVELCKITMVSMKSPWQHSYYTLNPFKKKYPRINTQQSIKWQVISFFCMFRLDIFWFISIIQFSIVDSWIRSSHCFTPNSGGPPSSRWFRRGRRRQEQPSDPECHLNHQDRLGIARGSKNWCLRNNEWWWTSTYYIKNYVFCFFHIQVPNILSVCFILGWIDMNMVLSWCFSGSLPSVFPRRRMWWESRCFCFVDPLIETPSLKSTNMLSQPKRIELWIKVCLECKWQIKV